MMNRCTIEKQQVVLHTEGQLCQDKQELLGSRVFERIVAGYCDRLSERRSPLFESIMEVCHAGEGWKEIVLLLRALSDKSLDEVVSIMPQWSPLTQGKGRATLHTFVEGLYDYWRSFDRYLVLHSEPGPSSFDQRPYRSFNSTVENLTHVVRAAYRDLCENITGDHPRIYRQVRAGCEVALIATRQKLKLPGDYGRLLAKVSVVRQAWIAPPLIIDPPMNKREGQFQRVEENPLDGVNLNPEEWVCFPAQVGPLVILVYFHQEFMGLGCALANLFELADDAQVRAKPDAIYVYGVPDDHLSKYGDLPTVFYDDEENDLLVGAVPLEDRFGYFGYLKKMILTLHNIVMMKRGRMPFHGAMTRISLKNGHTANILMIGDTATGKSELLEAFRILGSDKIRELSVIADDMGSLNVTHDGKVAAYGTETGAFIRLDDLQQGYVFAQVDRAVIMSPQKKNARVVVPVTTLEEVLHGYPVDILLYANNYEDVTEEYPVLEAFDTAEQALEVFRRGAAMSKGTTTSTGLVHSYFANVFGPPQYRHLHDGLAEQIFKAAFNSGVYVGQIRTRLGLEGCETSGPREAAAALLDVMSSLPNTERSRQG
ncbi:MAG: phosphoenolpyruvate carboxykinase [Dehalococcoidia bacterium]|nr:phosphoenolpyruvate carboxykinase [Dehalococcoidia bacterium]